MLSGVNVLQLRAFLVIHFILRLSVAYLRSSGGYVWLGKCSAGQWGYSISVMKRLSQHFNKDCSLLASLLAVSVSEIIMCVWSIQQFSLGSTRRVGLYIAWQHQALSSRDVFCIFIDRHKMLYNRLSRNISYSVLLYWRNITYAVELLKWKFVRL